MTNDKGIFIRNIYYMLAYAFQELKQNNYEEIAGEDFDEIHDLFAEILIRGISYQLKQGLHKEYVPKEESLVTLRGKLDINGTVKHIIRQEQKLACEYDELSENNLFNQIIKTTVMLLLKHSNVKTAKKNALKRLMLYFSGVDEIDVKCIKWTTLRFDRNTKTYQMLLYICYFIIDGMLLTTESGQYKMRAFSDEHMCRLYEKFVLEYYRKHFPFLNPRAAQIGWNIKEDVSSADVLPILQTDIMLDIAWRTLIIDTKYYGSVWQEHFDKKTVHSNNLNQIFTYVMNMDREHKGNVDGMLLYAKTQEQVTPDNQVVTGDGNVISFRTLDLNVDFSEISKRLDGLVWEEYHREKERVLEIMRKSGEEREAYWAQRRPQTREEYHKAFEAIYGHYREPKNAESKKK